MTIRQQAILDVCAILGDQDVGPGWPVVVTSPDGEIRRVTAITTDIGEELDPDTGLAVSGRRASCTFLIRSLTDAALGIPVNIPDQLSRPWLVSFNDSSGVERHYKVIDTLPDVAVGLVVCLLEVYQP